MTTPPGWYTDPAGAPGTIRWWDGERWTDHVRTTALPPPPVTAGDGLARERDVSRLAQAAALATGVAMPIQLAVSAFATSELVHFVDELVNAPDGSTTPAFRLDPVVSLTSNVLSLVVFAALVITLVWVHASATTAARLGIPATRSPGWAVGGFLIPVVNLWWPYQSVRDLFPAGHPARRLVGRWWALYLGAAFTPMIALGAAFVSVPTSLAVLACSAALYVGAAVTLRQVIGGAVDAHAELTGPPPA